MNDRTYLIPGLDGWTFKTSAYGYGLWSANNGPGVAMTSETTATEIAERVKAVLWLRSDMSGEAAETAAKAVLKADWQAMVREAGTDVQHQSPALPGWTLRISDLGSGLWYSNGSGVQLTADTTTQEITEGVQRVLQGSLPQVEIDVQVGEVEHINFRTLILNAWAPRPAPLLEDLTADNTALITTLVESICADVRRLSALKNLAAGVEK